MLTDPDTVFLVFHQGCEEDTYEGTYRTSAAADKAIAQMVATEQARGYSWIKASQYVVRQEIVQD